MTDLEVSCGSGCLCQQELSHNIEGPPIEVVALLEHLRCYAFQIRFDDISDTTGVRLRAWEANARTFLRSIIGEGAPPANSHANGHKTLPPYLEMSDALAMVSAPQANARPGAC